MSGLKDLLYPTTAFIRITNPSIIINSFEVENLKLGEVFEDQPIISGKITRNLTPDGWVEEIVLLLCQNHPANCRRCAITSCPKQTVS